MNIREVRQKQRYLAYEGDLIGLYGDDSKEFRLAIALGKWKKKKLEKYNA